MEDHFLFERDRLTEYGIQTCVFGKHFLGNEKSEPVTQEKQLGMFVANDKIQAFEQKLKHFKNSYLLQ